MLHDKLSYIIECGSPAWNDGRIRGFTPETGQLKLTVDNAHRIGVTAIAVTKDSRRIVSGGGEGQVRLHVPTNHITVLCRLFIRFYLTSSEMLKIM